MLRGILVCEPVWVFFKLKKNLAIITKMLKAKLFLAKELSDELNKKSFLPKTTLPLYKRGLLDIILPELTALNQVGTVKPGQIISTTHQKWSILSAMLTTFGCAGRHITPILEKHQRNDSTKKTRHFTVTNSSGKWPRKFERLRMPLNHKKRNLREKRYDEFASRTSEDMVTDSGSLFLRYDVESLMTL
jgi:tRNA nucleotidyltransferase (CCA-adding enzyme)